MSVCDLGPGGNAVPVRSDPSIVGERARSADVASARADVISDKRGGGYPAYSSSSSQTAIRRPRNGAARVVKARCASAYSRLPAAVSIGTGE